MNIVKGEGEKEPTPRGKEPIMTNKKNTITRAQALAAAIELFPEDAEEREVLSKMLASITRKSDKPKGLSKAAKENAVLAEKVLQILPEGEPMVTSEIMSKVPGIMTTQKCTKVMAVLVNAGKVTKVPHAKGRYTGYQLG